MPILPKVNAWWWSVADRKPLLTCALAGVSLALAFPPLPLAPLALVAWVPLFMVVERRIGNPDRRIGRWKRYWRAFKYGYVFWFCWNLGVNYWLLFTGWNMPDAETRIAGLISGIMANVANPVVQLSPLLVWVFLRKRLPGFWSFAVFPALYVALEFGHMHWDLTWSWNTLGNAFALIPWYVQYLEWTGVLGASLFILGANVLVFRMARQAYAQQPIAPRLRYALLGLLAFPLLGWPILTLDNRPALDPAGYLNVRILQPNLDPYSEKFGSMGAEQQVQLFIRQMREPGADTIDLALGPESFIPGRINEREVRQYWLVEPLLTQLQQTPRMNLMGGIISAWVFPRGQEPQRPLRYNPERDEFFEVYNAATLLSARLDTAHVYRKARLVPFSERPPFMETLEALKEYNLDLGGGFGAFGLPDSVTLLRTAQGVPVGPVICYESIFPDHVATLTRQGAQVLCILTNDGWWKQSSGYLQHAAFARLRAIETRRWVARSANTGRSVFISPWGTVQASLEWNQQGTLDARLPLLTAQTLYVQWGDWVGWGCVLLMCVLVIAGVVLSFAPNSRNQF